MKCILIVMTMAIILVVMIGCDSGDDCTECYDLGYQDGYYQGDGNGYINGYRTSSRLNSSYEHGYNEALNCVDEYGSTEACRDLRKCMKPYPNQSTRW